MLNTPTGMSPLEAYNALMLFAKKRGEGALRLVLHAAVPQSFRTDLLHLLRLNVVPEAASDPTVEADVLLAPFCAEIGGGYFQFDLEGRYLLLDNLDATYAQEAGSRLRRVANFLLHYIEHQSRRFEENQDRLSKEYLEIQRWVALAFLHPESAAEQLAAALEQVATQGDFVARVQLGGLASALSAPLVKYPKLLTYAAGLQALDTGRLQQ